MQKLYDENGIALYRGDARAMTLIPDNSVQLVVTSPPYFNARDYSQWATYPDYLADMGKAWLECHRVLAPTGRICVNVTWEYGYADAAVDLASDVWQQLRAHFVPFSKIIWWKGVGSNSTGWGSWRSARRPHVRGVCEVIYVAAKDDCRRAEKGESDIEPEEFASWTNNLWEFRAQSRHPWHSAPFPPELPYRCIKLFSYVTDTVLDPFAGSATTLQVARNLRRRAIGVEMSEEYAARAADDLRLGTLGARLKRQAAKIGYIQDSLLAQGENP